MHQNNGKSIADCLADRTDYAKNPDKANDGELLSSYQCHTRTVQGEFMLSKRQYDDITGRNQASNVIAYQIRQAFKPGESPYSKPHDLSFKSGNHYAFKSEDQKNFIRLRSLGERYSEGIRLTILPG